MHATGLEPQPGRRRHRDAAILNCTARPGWGAMGRAVTRKAITVAAEPIESKFPASTFEARGSWPSRACNSLGMSDQGRNVREDADPLAGGVDEMQRIAH